jgi:ubiquinone biosynthesis protein Coq4
MNDAERYQQELDDIIQQTNKRATISSQLWAHDHVHRLLERAFNVGIHDLSTIITSPENKLAQITAEVEKREATRSVHV